MAKAKNPSTKQLKAAKQANAKLVAENKKLKDKLDKSNKTKPSWLSRTWRTLVIMLLVGFAGALLFVGNIFFWAGRTVTNTDKYVQTVEPLGRNPEVQKAVSKYATTQFFNNVDVTKIAEEALPPRAVFLAEPLADNLKQHTEQTLNKIVASDRFQDIWIESQKRAHQRLITVAKNHEGNGTIDLNYLYQQLSRRLKDTKLSFLANKSLPSNVGSITVVQADWLPVFSNIVNNIELWRTLAIALLVLVSALAILISRNRRRTIIRLGLTFVFVMLFTLISFRIGREVIIGQVATEYQLAAKNAYQIIFHQLLLNTVTILILGLLIAISAWLGGKTKGATMVKKKTGLLFAGKMHEALLSGKENELTKWLGANKTMMRWLILASVVLLMLTVRLTPLAVLGYGLLALVLITLLETLAAPTAKPKITKK